MTKRRGDGLTQLELNLYVMWLSATGYQVYWALRHYAVEQPLHLSFCVKQARYQRELRNPALCMPLPLP